MYENITRISDIELKGKKAIMRVDFNVPIDKKTGEITSDKRIVEALPTINHALENGVERLALMSHLGKPKKVAESGKDFRKSLSLEVVAKRLSELLGFNVPLVPDYLGDDLPSGRVMLFENVRFNYEQEQSKNESIREQFAKKVAKHGELYINDAFGTCHRKEALVYDIAKFLPSAIGLLVEKEIRALMNLVENPKKQYIALLGGAKVEDKIKVIEALSEKVDFIFVMGAMEYAFRKAQGMDVGDSLCLGVDTAKKALSSDYASKLQFPVDAVIGRKTADGSYEDIKIVDAGAIPPGYMGLDSGPKTIEKILDFASQAKTIFWNGPLGVFEIPDFAKATMAVAKGLADSSAKVYVGGGDSVAAIEKAGVEGKYAHVSTGGGAALEFLENNGRLPCLDILEKK
jgi:3-phosphoglycerate kinase